MLILQNRRRLRAMLVKVYRYDPDSGKQPEFQSFEVPSRPDWTVMDVLDYIANHYNSSVAYYRHSACDHGICGRCLLKVNGKPELACTTQVGEADAIVLEPKNGKIVRDLVAR
jgi:succinate dehydrogenase / fumarate reductase iron-sulfur subunit